MKNLLPILFITLVFSGCEKKDLNWNLPRENPMDVNYDGTNENYGPIVFSRYEIACDLNGNGVQDPTDGNGIINPGEDIYMRVYIKNEGKIEIGDWMTGGVTVSLSENDSQISVTDELQYGSLKADEEKFSQSAYIYDPFEAMCNDEPYSISFEVKPNTPSGKVITINLKIKEDKSYSDYQWTDSFTFTVQ